MVAQTKDNFFTDIVRCRHIAVQDSLFAKSAYSDGEICNGFVALLLDVDPLTQFCVSF